MHTLQTALTELLNMHDYSFHIRSYSGRGMYGRSCLAITFDDNVSALSLGFYLAQTQAAFGDPSLSAEIGKVRSDSMGRGTVLYWPSIPYVDAEEKEEDIED